MKQIRFNINDNVKVKLTEEGIRIYRKYCKENGSTSSGFLNLDELGYKKFQFWVFMSIFGSNIGHGILPICTEIILLVSEDQ